VQEDTHNILFLVDELEPKVVGLLQPQVFVHLLQQYFTGGFCLEVQRKGLGSVTIPTENACRGI
jgi:hypothetical protein